MDNENDLTAEERERLLATIESQFELEILLKYREVEALENELERVQELKGLVQKLILNEHIYGESGVGSGRVSAPPGKNQSSSSTAAAYLQALEMDEDDEVFYHRRSASTVAGFPVGDEMAGYGSSRRRAANMAGFGALSGPKLGGISSAPQVLYDVRPDGTVVRMRCPVCGQERFRNMLGFVNHCRLNCKLVFITQEERLLKGGFPVSAADVPEEYKHLLSAEVTQDLEVVQICADVQPVQVLEHVQPEIAVERDEALDPAAFGLSALNLRSQPHHLAEQEESDLPSSTMRQISRYESRYYLRGLLVVGNQARCILGSGDEVWLGGRAATHYFKLCIDDVPNGSGSHEALGRSVLRHVKFVRFFLHPAYRPDDIVDIYERPFVLERPAYGEFPIRIQLHFYDEKNRPMDILHSVSIFSVTGAAYMHASERRVDVDIDKRTDFSLSNTSYASASSRLTPELDAPAPKMGQADSLSMLDSATRREADPALEAEVNPATLKYCRYCGVPHMPQWSFEIIQKNCAWKPRKMKVNTRSSAAGLFSGAQISETEIKFVPKQKGDAAENPASDAESNVPLQPEASDEQKMVMATALQLALPLLRPSDATSSVLLAATRSFLRSLLQGAIKQMPLPEKRAQLDQGLPSLLTPWHVFCAITRPPESPESVSTFDFLSNAFLSAGNAGQQPLQPPQD